MEVSLNLTKFAQVSKEVNGEIYNGEYCDLLLSELLFLAIMYTIKEDETVDDLHLSIDYNKLEFLGFIKIMDSSVDPPIIALRDRAINLFDKPADSIMELTRKYRELFPQGIRTGGYLVRSDEATIANKLRKFLKANKGVTHEQILEATKRYVERKRAEGWNYMKTASYFIYKDNESVLAAECELLLLNRLHPPKSDNINKMI